MKKTSIIISILVLVFVLSACSKIDNTAFENIKGSYSVVTSGEEDEVGSWWSLSICKDEDGQKYFSIYDTVGNPGVEGPITKLDENTLSIEVDKDLYEGMPVSEWEMDGKTLTFTYEKNSYDISLTNNYRTVEFTIPLVTISGYWKKDADYRIDEAVFENGMIKTSGLTHETFQNDPNGLDNEAGDELLIANNCKFIDDYTELSDISQNDFEKLLKSDASAGAVLEILYSDDYAYEIRLVNYKDSALYKM